MKQILIACAATVALVSVAAASGTTVTTTTTAPTATGAVTIQPEVQTKVKQYITTSKPKSVAVPSGFTIRQGVKLPETVEVQAFPADVGVTQYRYVVLGDQTVLVNGNREIVEVIR